MSLTPEALPVGFYEHSAALTQDEVIAKFDAWQTLKCVTSSMIQVGEIIPDITDTVLARKKMTKSTYGISYAVNTFGLEETLEDIVRADMDRSKLYGDLSVVALVGNYDDGIHREPWHSDNFNVPSVRWTVAFGVGATRGAEGRVSKADTTLSGDLLLPRFSPPNGLRELRFTEGAVTRFINSGDIHAGPIGNGPRLMIQATLALSV